MPSTQLIKDVSADMFHFHPMQTKNMQKVVDMSLDPKSASWGNRLSVQLCNDTDPLVAKWGVSTPREEARDDERYKRTYELNAPDDLVDLFRQIDDMVIEKAVENARDWFKKDIGREQIVEKYKSLLKEKDDEDPTVLLKIKCHPPSGKMWKCVGDTPPKNGHEVEDSTLSARLPRQLDYMNDDYRVVSALDLTDQSYVKGTDDKYYVPLPDIGATKIGKVDDDWAEVKPGSISDLTRNSKVVPVVKILGLWFSMDKFGVTVKTEALLVQTHATPTFMDSFVLSTAPVSAAPTGDIEAHA